MPAHRLLVLVASLSAITALPSSTGAAPPSADRTKRPRSPDRPPVVERLCAEGGCKGKDGRAARVTILRDKNGTIALLVYRGLECPHFSITYHDQRGEFLAAQQTGRVSPTSGTAQTIERSPSFGPV